MPDLTEKQEKLLNYIKSYTQTKGFAPSLREMADYLGLRSTSTVHQHLQALIKKNYIENSHSTERKAKIGGIKPNIPKLIRIPVAGTIAAGLPIEVYENPDPVYVSTQLAKNSNDYYALKVKGDSMIDDGVQDGDTVVIKSQNYVDRLNQTVVAIINGGATLKRFGGLDKDGNIKLIPRNPKMDIMIVEPYDFEIRGVFAGLIRGI